MINLWSFVVLNLHDFLLWKIFEEYLFRSDNKWVHFLNCFGPPLTVKRFSKISQILSWAHSMRTGHWFQSAWCSNELCIALLRCSKVLRCAKGVQCHLSRQINCCSSLSTWDVSNKGRNTCFEWLMGSDPTLPQWNPPVSTYFQMSDKANWKISATG